MWALQYCTHMLHAGSKVEWTAITCIQWGKGGCTQQRHVFLRQASLCLALSCTHASMLGHVVVRDPACGLDSHLLFSLCRSGLIELTKLSALLATVKVHSQAVGLYVYTLFHSCSDVIFAAVLCHVCVFDSNT